MKKTTSTTTTRRTRSKKSAPAPVATLPTLPPLPPVDKPQFGYAHARPCSLACAADTLKLREYTFYRKISGLAVKSKLDLSGVEKLTTWKALHDENGILRFSTWTDENGKTHRSYLFRHIAESFLTYCKNEIFGKPEHERLIKSCNGSFAGFNGDNPARLCAMAALYGLDNLSGACFRTPRAWQAAGYELKDTARPFFVVTPKFCEVVEKEDQAEDNPEEPAEKLTIKGAKDEYNLFPVYGSFDVQKVREKAVRKSRTAEKQAAEDSALDAARMEARAIMSQPAAAAAYSSGRLAFALVTAPAKKAAPVPDSLRQLALSL